MSVAMVANTAPFTSREPTVFGPMTRRPEAAWASAIAARSSPPSAGSEKPSANTRAARTPRRPHSRMAPGVRSAETQIRARSMSPGASASDRWQGRSPMRSWLGLTQWIAPA